MPPALQALLDFVFSLVAYQADGNEDRELEYRELEDRELEDRDLVEEHFTFF